MTADRARLPGEGVLEGQLGVLDGLGGLVADHHPLGHAAERAAGVPGAVVARPALIGGVVGQRRTVGHLGEDDQRRAAEQRLQVALPGVAGDPLALAHDDRGLTGEPARTPRPSTAPIDSSRTWIARMTGWSCRARHSGPV